MATSPATRRSKIFYGWYIVAAGTISGFLNLAIFIEGQSVFIKDVRQEMGWSLTAISLGFSLRSLEAGALSPVSGYLIDRLGPRVMAVAGTIFMSLGLILFSQTYSLSMFYISAAVIALGQGLGGMTAFLTATMHWFYRKRGMASALLAMGRGWGYVGILPLTLLLVAFGWRTAVMVAGIGFLAINLPLSLLLRHRPEPYGYFPDGATAPSPVPASSSDPADASRQEGGSFTLKEALLSLPFWMVMAANTLYSFTTQVQHVHMIPHLRERGFSAQSAATIIAVYGGIQVVGRLVCGWLGDVVGRQRLLMLSLLILAVGWVAAAYLSPHDPWVLLVFYLTFGMGQAAHTVTSQTMVADYFGTRHYATIRGFMSPTSVVGGVLGPLFAGFMFDVKGSYQLAMILLGPISLIGGLAIFLAGKPTLSGQHTERGEPSIQR
ncbi:MAG: MFS transporter [Chloroflexi bacterium]|nr:MFS transporter [Chloroflexota bacterium]